MNNEFEELDALLFDWETGGLSEEGVAELRNILRNSQAARQHFARHQALTAALQLEAAAGLPPEENPLATEPAATPSAVEQVPPAETATRAALPQKRGSSWAVWSPATWSPATWISIAGVVLLAVLAGGVFVGNSVWPPAVATVPDGLPATRDWTQEAQSHGVAIVTRLVDVKWKAGLQPLHIGDALQPGEFAIETGHAQIEFFSGATVIVEGPASLQLHSASLAHVRSGRLRAMVPPAARGFSLQVDDLKVVDLGTEFALSVSSEEASIQVFDGEVELHQPAQKKRLLTAGQALTRTAGGKYIKAATTPQKFVDISGLASRANGQNTARFQRWKDWSAELRQDPQLLLYYAFDQPQTSQRRLPCSITPVQRDLDGAIVGANYVSGRWASKAALEFKQPADRVRVNVPGEHGSLTFSCWVKIDSLDRWYNSLFLTDEYNQGEPHWQILDTGQLFFSVRSKPDHDGKGKPLHGATHHPVLSPPFWKPSMSGKWLHLATTYNAANGATSHYLNGQPLHTEKIPRKLVVKTTRIGPATLGNWSSPTRPEAGFAIRNLNGSIDEFAVFSAALTPAKIKEIYEHGAP